MAIQHITPTTIINFKDLLDNLLKLDYVYRRR